MATALLLKFILNGIIAGSLYAVLAIGLSLIYGILRFVNFAHGELALLGGYLYYTFAISLDWPALPALLAALSILCLVFLLMERLLLRPIRDAPPLIPLILTIALTYFLKNFFLIAWGPQVRSVTGTANSIALFSDIVRITDVQILIVVASLLLMAGLTVILKYTKIGRAIRAVSDNREAAAILGIPVNKVIASAFIITAVLAGCAGILAALDQNLQPNMGGFFVIKAFAAVILGGIGSIPGAVAGAFFIGLAENILIAIPFGDFYIPSNYKDAVAFAALLIFLYVKPTGFFGAASARR